MTDEEPLDPSGIAQFIEHDRCPRYIKQRVAPGDEPDAREWREAFGLMNVALLGNGQEFEAQQIEALAANATKVIGPAVEDRSKAGVPDISIDETWTDSARGRTEQLHTAIEDATTLSADIDDQPYILCYQAPLGGQLGGEDIWGEADCLVVAPTAAVQATESEEISASHPPRKDTDVVARVVDVKSAAAEKPAHRVQVAIYSALLEQTLAEGPTPCHIETSVLTQASAVEPGDAVTPFDLPTFRREEWELFARRLLTEGGPVDEALDDDLHDLPFTLDQVCNNCAYREACMTRAVEDPTDPDSLALLGLDASVQRALCEAGITSIRELSTLLPRSDAPRPTDDPPALDLDSAMRRKLEEVLPGPIHETVQRAQALRGEIDPDYPAFARPPAIPGTDWVPLPDDRCQGWSNIETAQQGELIHVALFVRPDTAIDRVAALGACVYAGDHDEYITIGEVIDAVPDDPDIAAEMEATLFERFLTQLFDAIETVATALGTPEESVIHCYTFTDHETEVLAEGLDRHVETVDHARAMRALLSLHPDGQADGDQSMVSAVQPILNEQFALQYPSQGLLTVTEQFVSNWTIEAFDPLDARPDDPPLRAIFREQFLNERVPYLEDNPGLRLHLARGPLAEGPAAAAVDRETDTPDGWYPIRKRAGGQFPLEYIWAVTPKHPDDDTPRLTPDAVEEWAVDEEHEPLYRQEVGRFYYRTDDQTDPLQREDVEYLVERLSYALQRLVEAIPYKDAYHPKEPLDATRLTTFDLPVTNLPDAARDYLHMEFGATRDTTLAHYRQSLRERARSGRSIPFKCTDMEPQPDGSLVLEGELAYDALFDDDDTAATVARQARIRSSTGPGSGSWRVLTRLQPTDPSPWAKASGTDTTGAGPSARGHTTVGVDDRETIKHSPPVLVDDLDQEAGTITVTTFPHRFRGNGSAFRVDHCGWHCPTGSNVSDPSAPPAERQGYVAGRNPVWIDVDEVYLLDPMIDDFGGPKADRALLPDTVAHNALWHHLQAIQATGQQQPAMVAAPAAVEEFLETLADAAGCLEPNTQQQAFIRAVDRALVPLQGPPGTGKTSGATAPALLARAYARQAHDEPFVGIVVAPSHEAVDAALEGVVEFLDDWRRATDGLSDLRLIRVVPAAPPTAEQRADHGADHTNVTFCNYHSPAGDTTLRELARTMDSPTGDTTTSDQCLLFATPSTLYRTLGVFAETMSAIDGETAPAAMRHDEGLADVVCIDEASMLDIPQLLLAGSALKPTGQTLLVGDHRQLATVTETDWSETLRKPLQETRAYYSALEYVRWLNATGGCTMVNSAVSDSVHRTHRPDSDSSGDSADDSGGEQR